MEAAFRLRWHPYRVAGVNGGVCAMGRTVKALEQRKVPLDSVFQNRRGGRFRPKFTFLLVTNRNDLDGRFIALLNAHTT